MDNEKLLNKHGIEIAKEKIAEEISKKIDEYNKTRNQEVKKQLATLLNDREKVYNNGIQTIEKYVKI